MDEIDSLRSGEQSLDEEQPEKQPDKIPLDRKSLDRETLGGDSALFIDTVMDTTESSGEVSGSDSSANISESQGLFPGSFDIPSLSPQGIEGMIRIFEETNKIALPSLSKIPASYKLRFEDAIRRIYNKKIDPRTAGIVEEVADLAYQATKLLVVKLEILTEANQRPLYERYKEAKQKPSFAALHDEASYLAERMVESNRGIEQVFETAWPKKAFPSENRSLMHDFFADQLVTYICRTIRQESGEKTANTTKASHAFQDATDIQERMCEELKELLQYVFVYDLYDETIKCCINCSAQLDKDIPDTTSLHQRIRNLIRADQGKIANTTKKFMLFLENEMLSKRAPYGIHVSDAFELCLLKLRGRQEFTYSKPRQDKSNSREFFKPIEKVLYADFVDSYQ